MKKEFHVLYIITKLELGGAQKVCLSLFKSFKNSTLVSGDKGSLVGEAKKCGDVKLSPYLVREIGVVGILREFKAFFVLFREIKKLREKHKNLIVHTHSSKAGIMGRWAAWLAGCRLIVHTVHGFSFNDFQAFYVRWIFKSLEWLTSLITAKFVCVSNKDKETGIRLFSRFSKKVVLIRAAVDDIKFSPAILCSKRVSNKKLIIGSVGCFKPQKNLFDLLKAFELVALKARGFRPELQILGDGILRPDLEKWIEDKGLSDIVKLPGWVSSVEKFMANWDIFAMSSLWEGLPCAVVEARLCSLPVVTYDIGGISEVVKDGKNGFLVKPGDWQTLSRRLKELVYDESLRMRLGSGFKDNLNEFFCEEMVEGHRALYEEISFK
ncbi:glycosyltransferase family 4 protein [Candidatus Dependentiae bacterium]